MRPLLALLLLGVPAVASAQAVGLAADGGAPLERVAITRLPAVGNTLRVEVRAPGYDAYPALTDSTDDGRIALVVPIHPDVLTGGPVTLAFFDGDRTLGEVAPFHVAPVPPAPGTLRRVVELQRETLAAEAALYGFTLDDLRRPADLPVQLWPAAVALGALDDPRNPNALTAMLGGTAPAMGGRPIDLEVADALAALVGVDAVAAEHLRAIEALGPPPEPVRLVEVSAGGAAVFPVEAPRGPAAPDPAGRPRSILRVDIPNAAVLNYYMRLAETKRAEAESLANKVLGDANNAAGLVPNPIVRGASVLVSLTLFGHIKGAEAASQLLPSSLGNPRARFSTTSFNEDDTTGGRWSKFTVTAASRGSWDVAQATVEAALETLVAGKGVKGAWDTPLKNVSLNEQLDDVVKSYADAERDNMIKKELVGLTPNSDGTFTVGPYTWDPVDITDEAWSTARAHGDHVIAVDPIDPHAYFPSAVGRGAVQLLPREDRFPPLTNVGRGTVNRTMEVEAILVTLDPATAVVRPGSRVTLTATVRHANDPALGWEASAGTLSPAGENTVVLEVPDVDGAVVTVTATSLSRTGLRAPDRSPEPRIATGGYTLRKEEEEEEEVAEVAVEDVPTCSYTLSVRGDVAVSDEGDNALAFMWNVPHDDGRYSFTLDNAAFSLPRGYLFHAGLGEASAPPVRTTGRFPLEYASFQPIEGRAPGAVFEHSSVRPSPDPPVLTVTAITPTWLEGEVAGTLVAWDKETRQPVGRVRVRASFRQAHGSRPFACGGDAAIEEVIESPVGTDLLEDSPALQERLRDVLGRRRGSGR